MKVPTSTYRLQLNAEFKLSHVRELIPYFSALGVGHLYLSPIFQARPGSPHGYDITNPGQVNREIGDEAEFTELSQQLRAAGIGLVLDIVPNHMAADAQNPWWRDVLEHGPASLAANFFDIAWDAPGCNARVILPVLGQPLADASAAHEVRVEERDGELVVAYFTRFFPLDPATYADVLRDLPNSEPLIAAARAIGPRHAATPEAKQQRRQHGLALKQRLRDWLVGPGNASALEQRLVSMQHAELLRLLAQQAYSLEFWRAGVGRLNYRRFFDISDLAAVRVEDAEVFATTHALILELIRARLIDGVRVDHIDGLRDPAGYLQQLRTVIGDEYIVVEKILAPTEDLPEDWPIEGTTGYDFLGLTAAMYCLPEGLAKLAESYATRTGNASFGEIVYEAKKLVIDRLFAAELHALTVAFADIAAAMGITCERETAAACITEVTASMQVYRTYVGSSEVGNYDRSVIKHALTTSRHRAPGIPDAVFALFRAVLLNEDFPNELLSARAEFIAGWQQFTGPVTAKGVEDTAFYRYHALIAQCEVGAQPHTTIASGEELHALIQKRSRRWPFALNGSSTHDTKRSEDVRARIEVLSEFPDAWEDALTRWAPLTERHVQYVDGVRVPAVNEELLILQTLVGAWPLSQDDEAGLRPRLIATVQKSAREAKLFSSWTNPDQCYEDAIFDFVEQLLDDEDFVTDFRAFHESIAWFGALNSLSQLVLKLGAPGVPDIYQGNETWQFSMVDPDNRRPIDFAALHANLAARAADVTASDAGTLLREWRDGFIKLHVTQTGLQMRRQHEQLFLNGEFIPVTVRGRFANNVVAFMRRHEDNWALVVVGRFYSRVGPRPLGAAWLDTTLDLPSNAPTSWRNVFTSEVTDGASIEAIFATLPCAILNGVV